MHKNTTCSKCLVILNESNTGSVKSKCKVCVAEYAREFYKRNEVYRKDKNKKDVIRGRFYYKNGLIKKRKRIYIYKRKNGVVARTKFTNDEERKLAKKIRDLKYTRKPERNTPDRYLQKMFQKAKYRSKTKPRYKLLGNSLVLRDFISFAYSNDTYTKVYQKWVNSGFSKRLSPSIDRIDNNKGYHIGNIQFLNHSENSSKGNK